MELEEVVDKFDYLSGLFSKKGGTARQFVGDALNNLYAVVGHQMSLGIFYQIDRDKGKLIRGDRRNAVIIKSYPECGVDLVEAEMCLALDRPTATVFHCMRLLEILLKKAVVKKARGVGIRLSESKTLDKNWESALRTLEIKIAAMEKRRKSPSAKRRLKHLSELCAHMRSVKNAFRNEVMHAKGIYESGIASDILSQTTVFARYVAS